MSALRLNIRGAIPATQGDQYHPRLRALNEAPASGVYAIIDAATREILYIGESHTGRLYDTITRHFREWSTPSTDGGRREGGTQYHRDRVKVTWRACPANQAQDFQYREIQRLQPADNLFDGATIPNPAPTKRAVQDAEAAWGRAASTYGNDNRETVRKLTDFYALRDAWEKAAGKPYGKLRLAALPNPPRRRFDGARVSLEYVRSGKRYRHDFKRAHIEVGPAGLAIVGPGVTAKPDPSGQEWLHG